MKISVPIAQPVTHKVYKSATYQPAPVALVALPGVGGTLLVETTPSEEFLINQNDPAIVWEPWVVGGVSSRQVAVFPYPMLGMRFTAAGAAGVVEVLQ